MECIQKICPTCKTYRYCYVDNQVESFVWRCKTCGEGHNDDRAVYLGSQSGAV